MEHSASIMTDKESDNFMFSLPCPILTGAFRIQAIVRADIHAVCALLLSLLM